MILNRVIKRLIIEMSGTTKQYQVSAKQYDRATRYVEIQLTSNGEEYIIPDSAIVTAYIRKPDGTTTCAACTSEGSVITVELASSALSAAGTAIAEIEIKSSDVLEVATSRTFEIEIEPAVKDPDAVPSEDELSAFDAVLRKYAEAETGRVSAESARADAETARDTAETARATAEGSRASAESDRVTAESGRESAESLREAAETERDSAESGRATAESGRSAAEAARVQAETGRVSAESARVDAETARDTAETARATAEGSRASAESDRVTAESGRSAAEAARAAAETAREEAEAQRGIELANKVDKDEALLDLDINAEPGTVDYELYQAIVALGWENEVIVN